MVVNLPQIFPFLIPFSKNFWQRFFTLLEIICFWGEINIVLEWVVLVLAPTLVLATTGGEKVIKEDTVVIINDKKLVDDELGVDRADWNGRVDGGVGCASGLECGTEVSEEEIDGRAATCGGEFVKTGDDSNVDSIEVEEVRSDGTDSDGRLDGGVGCVSKLGCKPELEEEGVVMSKSSSVSAKSRTINSSAWLRLRFSVTKKFDTAKLVLW